MAPFNLPERCDRAAAAALLPDLVEALGQGTREIDGSQVRQAGLAVLQLLASARKDHETLQIVASDVLREAAQITGLENHLFGATSR